MARSRTTRRRTSATKIQAIRVDRSKDGALDVAMLSTNKRDAGDDQLLIELGSARGRALFDLARDALCHGLNVSIGAHPSTPPGSHRFVDQIEIRA